MANLAGVAHRLRLILAALTRKSSNLPIPIEDSTYYDIVRVAGDGAGVPAASADLFTVLKPYLLEPAAADEAQLERYSHLCRDISGDRSACEPDVGRLLYRLVRLVKPECALEVGVYKGAATCHIAQALKDNGTSSKYHLVDLSEEFLDLTWRQLLDFKLIENVVLHCGDALELAQRGDLPLSEFVYLDAHVGEIDVRDDLVDFLPLVRPGGILVLHNTILWNGARIQANRLALSSPGAVMTLATSGGSGISIIRKDGTPR